MLRALPLALLAAAPSWGKEAPTACGVLPAGELRLEAADFRLEYQPNRGVLRLRLPTQLPATTTRPPVELVAGLDEVPVALDQAGMLRAAHRTGALYALLGVREAPGPRADAACGELTVESIRLFVGEMLMASNHLAHAVRGVPAPLGTRVRVGGLKQEEGSADVAAGFVSQQLRDSSEICLRRVARGRQVRGTVVLEIRSLDAGTMQRPTAPVDSLNHPALVFCMLNTVYDDEGFARSMPPGAHFYAPVYFGGSALERSHSKAP